MHVVPARIPELAERLLVERKRQGLSRSQAAAVCNVSPSFIRDAESAPERCSIGKLLLLIQGLGLALEVSGWTDEPQAADMGEPVASRTPPSAEPTP